MRTIRIGDTFEYTLQGITWVCRREQDQADPNGPHRVTCLSCSHEPGGGLVYTFSTEQEWFRQRGMVAE